MKCSKIRRTIQKIGNLNYKQATKDSKMRGSYKIIYDVDIEIIVINGVVMTNKNRFKEKEFKTGNISKLIK